MRPRSALALNGIPRAAATFLVLSLGGCARTHAGSASFARSNVITVAALPPAWATEPAPFVVSAPSPAEVARDRVGIRLVSSASLGRALSRSPAGCAADPACVRALARELGADHVVRVELAALGATVLVRASALDGPSGQRTALRQLVVREADPERVRRATARVVRELLVAWSQPARAATTPWYQSPWTWIAVGGVIAAGSTAALWFGDSNDRTPDHVIRPP
ncbi:MAG: hypothetical protein NZ898_09355 [Myxococcota bacterium]|nr:hypothetical protein [Myxococcota bacterium]MDW8362807.1 hypothetical protein [Myxococcales bacterium]